MCCTTHQGAGCTAAAGHMGSGKSVRSVRPCSPSVQSVQSVQSVREVVRAIRAVRAVRAVRTKVRAFVPTCDVCATSSVPTCGVRASIVCANNFCLCKGVCVKTHVRAINILTAASVQRISETPEAVSLAETITAAVYASLLTYQCHALYRWVQ